MIYSEVKENILADTKKSPQRSLNNRANLTNSRSSSDGFLNSLDVHFFIKIDNVISYDIT